MEFLHECDNFLNWFEDIYLQTVAQYCERFRMSETDAEN